MSPFTVIGRYFAAFLLACGLLSPAVSSAALVTLQNPTATAEQGWGGGVASTIDGITDPTGNNNGWAFCVNTGCGAVAQAGVWQTAALLSASSLTFDLYFGCTGCGLGHKFQDMQFAYTTSANPTTSSGAIWNVLTPTSVNASFATLAISGTKVLASGLETNGDRYSITMSGLSLMDVTGFRLNIGLGPNGYIGFSDASNGNAVLEEFQVSASNNANPVPEPETLVLLCLGLAGLLGVRRKLG